ncbi:NAD(P)H-hydrate dehydratase [Pseudoduganella sp. DS3]|uniref:ADP-dependent (S)-NAD(P)H-hydrate dehydratase n=1 Tax=Pseudoduganella guangdongensis TaxID=2692179 RepID=A0A6N9HQ26_9BURK|nr:NAD(P)H-hydrate dehydratase [Pseudoduganella guangdongensis]MYN05407.1 NAD(P)H-hydrate dehydratase [Pseudoduganella guangdongensis]
MSRLPATELNPALLRRWPLPQPGFDGDKETRGHVLVVAGSAEMPGAALLAAEAALRAGAGKLTVGTAASVAPQLGTALPEARVIGLGETAAHGVQADSARRLGELAGKVDALLVGPGMQDEASCVELVHGLLERFGSIPILLDAQAMCTVHPRREPHLLDEAVDWEQFRFPSPVLLTPHAGELARLTGKERAAIEQAPHDAARAAAERWNAVVALKGATTVLAAPDGSLWQHQGGNAGLAISGSGDVLAGIIAGLLARGTTLEQAAAWGVALHGAAGEQLALRCGPLGYLAREIAAEVPALLRVLAAQ